MTPRDQLRQLLQAAEAAGCHQKPEYHEARGALSLDDPRLFERATHRLRDILAVKDRLDQAVSWFEKQKTTTRDQVTDSPEITQGFLRYDQALKQYGDNWYSLVPQLERIKELLERALNHHEKSGVALTELAKRMRPWQEDRRFEYINFRRKRLEAQYSHGYSVTLAEIEKWIAEVTRREEEIAREESVPAIDTVNSYLESQINRYEETMTVADFKKLQSLTEKIDNPASRMALWNLLREYEGKHATKLDLVKLTKLKKPKLSSEQTRDGWETLTLIAEADDTDARREVLAEMRSALQKKQGKRASSGIASALTSARQLSEDVDEA